MPGPSGFLRTLLSFLWDHVVGGGGGGGGGGGVHVCVCVGVCGLLVLWPLVWSTEGHKGTEDWWVRVSWGGVVPWASINSGWKAMCPPLFP